MARAVQLKPGAVLKYPAESVRPKNGNGRSMAAQAVFDIKPTT
jgi:hypothetical protein